MKQTKKQAGKEENKAVSEEKKSKIALYWESRSDTRGKINTMRQVLK
jgi:hypothetical protein